LSAGSPIQIQKIFQAQTNQAVAFPLYVCDHAIGTPGIVVDIDSSFRQLPPLSTILHFGRRSQSRQIAVRLEGEYTEIGTLNLQLKAVDTPHQFHLDFQLQAPELSLNEEEVLRISQKQQDYWRTLLKNFHSKAPDAVNGLLKKWEKESDFRRSELDIRDLRGLLDDLLPLADCLQNSRFHEENWLNLAGFLLRPGIGFPGDETRCRRLHTKIHSGLIHARALPVRIQSLILYRRIAAGLTEIQQNEMFRSIKKEFKSHNERELKKTLTFSNQEKAECWRTAVCLEKLPVKEKELLGETLLEGLPLIQNNPMLPWLLGRLITRRPLNASLSHVIPPEAAAIWLNFLFQHSDVVFRSHPLGLALAVHPTGDRAIDLPEDIHQTAMDYLRNWDVDENILMIAEGRALPSREQQSLLLGDALPLGLSM
jgi:hypothetical protein